MIFPLPNNEWCDEFYDATKFNSIHFYGSFFISFEWYRQDDAWLKFHFYCEVELRCWSISMISIPEKRKSPFALFSNSWARSTKLEHKNRTGRMSVYLNKYLLWLGCEPHPKHLLMTPIFIIRLKNIWKTFKFTNWSQWMFDWALIWVKSCLSISIHVLLHARILPALTHFLIYWLHSLFFSSFWVPINESWLSKYAFFSRYHSVVCNGFWTGPSNKCS